MDNLRQPRVEVLRSAARWYALLCSEDVTERQRQDHSLWLDANPAHQQAWQQVEKLREQLQSVPGTPAFEALRIKQLQGQSRRTVLRGLALFVGGTAVGGLAWRQAPSGNWVDSWTAGHRTGRGERRELTLSDGTRLVLNAATALDLVETPGSLMIRLYEGEIFIRTGKRTDGSVTSRELQIHTAQGIVLPLGTAFTVRQLDTDTQVSVIEDSVELIPVQGNGKIRQLEAGQQARMSAKEVTVSPSTVQAHSWTEGMLVAVDWPLERLVEELGRYRSGILRCDTAIAGLRVSGTFPVDDTERALQAIANGLPVRIQRVTDFWVTIKPLADPEMKNI